MPNTRLTTFLSRFLALAPAAGCIITLPGEDSGTPALDDVACLSVELGESCPDEATASSLLVGTQTCESPVREVVATGALLTDEDGIYTGYGGFHPLDTGATPDTGSVATRCCYEAAYIVHEDMGCTIGRPLVVDGRQVSAAGAARADWCAALNPDVSALDEAARVALAHSWTEAGLMEHASIPAFARVVLELLALGAPSELVGRTVAAMNDEVIHARACFALASAYAGRPVGPSTLDVPTKAAPSLVALAVDTFREGCVGETLAVGLAAAQLRTATDPAVRVVLERIVRDEGEHASLAWDTVRWAIDVGGDEVRHAVAAALATIDADALGERLRGGPASALAHGLADPAIAREALRGVFVEVVAPSAAELLAA